MLRAAARHAVANPTVDAGLDIGPTQREVDAQSYEVGWHVGELLRVLLLAAVVLVVGDVGVDQDSSDRGGCWGVVVQVLHRFEVREAVVPGAPHEELVLDGFGQEMSEHGRNVLVGQYVAPKQVIPVPFGRVVVISRQFAEIEKSTKVEKCEG